MTTDDYLKRLKRIRGNLYGKIRDKQRDGFVDCCEEFKFIRDFDTYNFNKKMNFLGITDLVLFDGKTENDEGYNLHKMITNTIINPIRYNSNLVVGIIGETGSGKSELAQALALISRQSNKKYKKRNVEIYICWTSEDLFDTLTKIKKGDIILKDESPKAFGEGAHIEKWSIDNALSVIRKEQNMFIFCDPRDIKINLCDLYLETAGMNLKTRTNRFMVLNKEREYFGHIYTELHDDKKFRDRYEKEKDLFVKEAKRLAGKFLSGLRKDKIQFIEEELTNEEEKAIYSPIKYLEIYLKRHDNRITIKEYADILKESEYKASKKLKNFVKEKKLKSEKEDKGRFVFFL